MTPLIWSFETPANAHLRPVQNLSFDGWYWPGIDWHKLSWSIAQCLVKHVLPLLSVEPANQLNERLALQRSLVVKAHNAFRDCRFSTTHPAA